MQTSMKESAMPAHDQTSETTPKKNMLPLVAGLAIVLVLFGIGAYAVTRMQVARLSESPLVLTAARLFHIPAVKVNGDAILYSDYVDDKKTLAYFYGQQPEAQVNPSTDEDISDMAISRLIATTVITDFAKKWNVEVTKEDIQDKKDILITNIGSEEAAEQEVMANYGWSLNMYIDRVVVPLIREEKIKAYFETQQVEGADAFGQEEVHARHILFRVEEESEDATVKQAATDVLTRIKNGEDFATLAKEFGSDGTAEVGGDLGWFGRGVMVPEFEVGVFALNPGQVGDELVKTDFGYHIVQVDEKRQGKNFIAFMDEQFNTADIDFLIPIHNPFEEAAMMQIEEGEMQQ